MNARNRHRLVKEIFLEACELQPEARDEYLARACRDDVSLRPQVERLLAAERIQPEFLEDSPVRSAEGVCELARELPERVGSFRVIGLLGSGGMGEVFEAEQDDPCRRVALKVLRLGYALPKLLERFEFEKDVLARLQHPGIAQIFEAGTAELRGVRQPYFAMELVAGKPLNEHAAEIDLHARLELFVLVCDAVQHAHQKGVVHRDLKPANILVTSDGQPKVLDFGIARAADAEVQLTTFGTDVSQIIGTLPYMSPEQASAPEDIDARSDVYGLGVILYELMTGQLPYDLCNTSLPAAVRIICEREPKPISTTKRHLRGDLETIAGKALAKGREHRYVSADALAADVRRYLRDEPIEARPASRLYKLAKFTRRNKLLVTSALLLFCSLVAGIWLATNLALRESAKRLETERRTYRRTIAAVANGVRIGKIEEAGAALAALAATGTAYRDWEWDYWHARLDQPTRVFNDLDVDVPPTYLAFAGGQEELVLIDVRSDARVYDVRTGHHESHSFELPGELAGPRSAVALSHDGRLCLTMTKVFEHGAAKEIAILWETRSGRIVQRFGEAGPECPNSGWATISKGGQYVTVPAGNGTLLYETESGQPKHRFPGAKVCGFDRQGEWLAVARHGEVQIWDVAEGKPVRDVMFCGRSVDELAFSPDRTRLVTSFGSKICVWLVENGELLRTINATGHPVYNLVFGNGGAALLATSNGAIEMWNPASGELMRTFPAYVRYGAVSCFSPNGRLLATGHSQKHQQLGDDVIKNCGFRIWDLAETSALVLRGHESYVYPVSISRDGAYIASGSFNGEVRLWDVDTSREVRRLRNADDSVIYSLAFDPRGKRLVSAGRSTQIWDLETGAMTRALKISSQAVAYSPDGSLLVIGQPGRLHVRDGRTLEHLADFDTLSGVVAFSPRGDVFATGRKGCTSITVWRAGSLEPAYELSGESGIESIAFSPDGARLATGGNRGVLTVWDLTTREPRTIVAQKPHGPSHRREVHAVCFLSPRRVATGGRDGIIRIWDVSSQQLALVTELRGHEGYVYSLALSPDRKRLVSGSGDFTVRIWETYPISRRFAARRGK